MVVFFFKQKTAYELRISDWSSDVCSSDLLDANALARPKRDRLGGVAHLHAIERPHEALHVSGQMDVDRPGGRTHVRVALERDEVAIGEHAMAHIFESG